MKAPGYCRSPPLDAPALQREELPAINSRRASAAEGGTAGFSYGSLDSDLLM